VNESENQHGISFSNVICTKSWHYTAVYGEVINNSNQSYSKIVLTIRFYDENNEFVGKGEGAVWHLNAGSIQLFWVLADENVAVDAVSASFEVSEIEVGEYIPLDVIEFSNIRADIVDNRVSIIGYVENIGLERYSFSFLIGAYDIQGNLIGVALWGEDPLEIAEKREFTTHNRTGDILSATTFRAFITQFLVVGNVGD